MLLAVLVAIVAAALRKFIFNNRYLIIASYHQNLSNTFHLLRYYKLGQSCVQRCTYEPVKTNVFFLLCFKSFDFIQYFSYKCLETCLCDKHLLHNIFLCIFSLICLTSLSFSLSLSLLILISEGDHGGVDWSYTIRANLKMTIISRK